MTSVTDKRNRSHSPLLMDVWVSMSGKHIRAISGGQVMRQLFLLIILNLYMADRIYRLSGSSTVWLRQAIRSSPMSDGRYYNTACGCDVLGHVCTSRYPITRPVIEHAPADIPAENLRQPGLSSAARCGPW